MKITNREIRLRVKKDDQIISEKVIKNRILNNYLLYVIEKTVGTNINTEAPTGFLYLKFETTQTITDESTTMNYDIKTGATLLESLKTTNSNLFSVENFYKFTITPTYEHKQLYGIGFGIDESEHPDWLMAFVSVEELNIELKDGESIEIIRIDDFYTDSTLIPGTTEFSQYPFHLGYREATQDGRRVWSRLSSIDYSYYEDGSNPFYNYKVYDETGTVIIPYSQDGAKFEFDFDNYLISDQIEDYPQEDYPQEDYPAPKNKTLMTKVYNYDVWEAYAVGTDTIIDSYKYIKNLEPQEIDKKNKPIKEVYKLERRV